MHFAWLQTNFVNNKCLLLIYFSQARCTVEHFQQPLRIEFTGSSIKQPAAIGTLKFVCPVRNQTSQDVPIENP